MRLAPFLLAVVLGAQVSSGCGVTGTTAAEEVAVSFVEASLAQDVGAAWDLLHPALKAETPRSEFTRCTLQQSLTPTLNDIHVSIVDSYDEDGFTYIDLRAEATRTTQADFSERLSLIAATGTGGLWYVVSVYPSDISPCTPDVDLAKVQIGCSLYNDVGSAAFLTCIEAERRR